MSSNNNNGASKVIKGILIAAAICAVIGIVLLGIGIHNGGRLSSANLSLIDPFNWFKFTSGDHDVRIVVGSDDDHEWVTGSSHFDFANDGTIENLDFSIPAAEVNFIESDKDYSIDVESNRRFAQYKVYQDGDTLVVKADESDWDFDGDDKTQITIAMPRNVKLKNVNLDIAAALVKSECAFDCESFSLSLGAGSVTLDSVAAKDSKIELAAGEFICRKLVCDDCDIDMAMGSVDISGTIRDDADIDCAMGELRLNLEDNEKDHNYCIDAGVGTVRIGSRKLSDVAFDGDIDNGADSDYNIKCAVGEVVIDFAL